MSILDFKSLKWSLSIFKHKTNCIAHCYQSSTGNGILNSVITVFVRLLATSFIYLLPGGKREEGDRHEGRAGARGVAQSHQRP